MNPPLNEALESRRGGVEPYPFDWLDLVPRFVHPIKVTIIEAMAWLDRPLSPKELERIFDQRHGVSLIAYHVKKLVEAGVLENVGHRAVRGARENYFYFRPTDT